MKKIALSLIALAASGAYVWAARVPPSPAGDPIALAPAGIDGRAAQAPVPAVTAIWSSPAAIVPPPTPDESALAQPSAGETPLPVRTQAFDPPVPMPTASALEVPLPHVRPTAARLKPKLVAGAAVVAGGFADGTFTGSAADAYYGQVQVQAIVQSGRIVAIKVLQYPSDRRTSVAINRQALPMLRDEVISAQSAQVDIVSGATLTSEAFIQSLTAALQGARA